MKPFKVLMLILFIVAPSQWAASASPLDDFKRAALEHARYQACFRSKLVTGYCMIHESSTDHVSALSGEVLESRIAYRLSQLSTEGSKTAALVYFEAADESGSASIFLFDEEGLQESVVWPEADFGAAVDAIFAEFNVATRFTRQLVGRSFAPMLISQAATGMAVTDASGYLLPPEIGAVIEQSSYDRLVILPSGSVSVAPFPVLDLPSGRKLIDVASVVILPDLEALTLPLGMGDDMRSILAEILTFDGANVLAPDKESLIVGDPDYAPYEGAPLHKLNGAFEEASFVAEKVGVRPLLGEEATHAAVAGELGDPNKRFGLIFMSSHGISDQVNPMDASLIALAGRHLLAREIRRLDFRNSHPLVVLSACQTGLGKGFAGGAFGLQRAWYHAGAGQVIGSLWNVSDEGTLYLMKAFIEQMHSGETRPEEALRQAMLETRENYGIDPAVWASFYVFGNPAQ